MEGDEISCTVLDSPNPFGGFENVRIDFSKTSCTNY